MEGKNKNFILFLVLALLLMFGGMELQRRIWPPPEKKKPDLPDQVKVDPKPPDKPPERDPLADQLAWSSRVVLQTAFQTARAQVSQVPRKRITLGDDSTNLKVILDSRGAGVRGVTLNKFQQADRMGRPEWNDEKTKEIKPLELVMEELNQASGSNLLFHFDPDRKGNDPLPALGMENWRLVEPATVEEGKTYSRAVFTTEVDGVRITKTFTLKPQDYHVGLEVELERLTDVPAGKPFFFRYQLTSAHGLRIEGDWYTGVLRNAVIGWKDTKKDSFYRSLEEARRVGLRLGGDPIEAKENQQIRYVGIAVQFFASLLVVDNEQENLGYLARARSTLEGAAMKGVVKKDSINKDLNKFVLIGTDNKDYDFYLSIGTFWPPNLEGGREVAVVYALDEYDRRMVTAFQPADATEPVFYNDIIARVTTEPIELKTGAKVVHKYLLYNGPVKVRLLGQLEGDKAVPQELVDRYEDTLRLNTLTDYPSNAVSETLNSIGFTWLLVKCTNLMHGVLWGLHHYLMPWSWGLCIIMLTVLVRGMMFPISRRQALAGQQMQDKMAKLKPELQKIQEKYKNDRQALSQAQMELYRKYGINPLGSCWMVFLQMPIFLGLYYALQESIHFRLAPFWPWIENLAAPDMLIRWGDGIPWISRINDYGGFIYLGPYFNLLPVIAVALMIVQQSLMTPPAMDEQQALNMKVMKYSMIIFGILFYKVAAGLCIYFIASSLWGVAERKLLPKKKPTPGTAEPAEGKSSFLSRMMDKVESLRSPPPQPPTAPTSGPTTNGPATGNGSVPASIPGSTPPNQKKRDRRKRRGRRGELAGASPGPASSPTNVEQGNGVRGKMRSWWSGLREWWAELLKKAEKK